MNKLLKYLLIVIGLGVVILASLFLLNAAKTKPSFFPNPASSENLDTFDHPMAIESLRQRDYPASEIVVEETLSPGPNYTRQVVSYKSDGLKIYGLLTIPTTPKPERGFPTVIVLHGYINPKVYNTIQNYSSSQAGLAKNGFITFKIDLRGHGKSEGQATGAHFSGDYTVDTLNAVSALKTYSNADPERIGVWGHSNGGEIGLRAMVVSKDIKSGVFWA
jgi:cephalosporin-C deacetylase-like acetyl esterase